MQASHGILRITGFFNTKKDSCFQFDLVLFLHLGILWHLMEANYLSTFYVIAKKTKVNVGSILLLSHLLSWLSHIQKSAVARATVIHITAVYNSADPLPASVTVVRWRLYSHAT